MGIWIEQGHGGQVEALGDSAEDAKAWIPYATLNLGYECAIDIRVQGQAFLSQAQLCPPALDARRERLPGRLIDSRFHMAKL